MRIRYMMAGAVMSILSIAGATAAELDAPDASAPPPAAAPAAPPAPPAQEGASPAPAAPDNQPPAAAPAPGASAPEAAPPAETQPPVSKEIVELQGVHALIGKEVRSSKGEPMGRIINVLVDGTGAPRAAVIDFGGFLGVGMRKIAVDWSALQFSPYQDYERISVALTRDEVKAAPEFKDEQRVLAVGVSGAASGQ